MHSPARARGEGPLEGVQGGREPLRLRAESDADPARLGEEASGGHGESETLRGEGGEGVPLPGVGEQGPGGGPACGNRSEEWNPAAEQLSPAGVVRREHPMGARPQRVEVRHQLERERDARQGGRDRKTVLHRGATGQDFVAAGDPADAKPPQPIDLRERRGRDPARTERGESPRPFRIRVAEDLIAQQPHVAALGQLVQSTGIISRQRRPAGIVEVGQHHHAGRGAQGRFDRGGERRAFGGKRPLEPAHADVEQSGHLAVRLIAWRLDDDFVPAMQERGEDQCVGLAPAGGEQDTASGRSPARGEDPLQLGLQRVADRRQSSVARQPQGLEIRGVDAALAEVETVVQRMGLRPGHVVQGRL